MTSPSQACTATTAAGHPCKRPAQGGATLCATHAAAQARADRTSYYGDSFPATARAALAIASTLEGIDQEIAVMRALIRQVLTLGDVREARQSIEALGRLLKLRHDITDHTAENMDDALNRVLDTLSEELGTKL